MVQCWGNYIVAKNLRAWSNDSFVASFARKGRARPIMSVSDLAVQREMTKFSRAGHGRACNMNECNLLFLCRRVKRHRNILEQLWHVQWLRTCWRRTCWRLKTTTQLPPHKFMSTEQTNLKEHYILKGIEAKPRVFMNIRKLHYNHLWCIIRCANEMLELSCIVRSKTPTHCLGKSFSQT